MNSKNKLAKFVERLVEARQAKGITGFALSKELGLNSRYVRSYEKGKSFPGVATFFAIAATLDICPYYLSGHSDTKRPWQP